MRPIYLLLTILLLISQVTLADQIQVEPSLRSHATISPDGEKMIYHGRGEGLQSTLFVADKHGENEKLFWGTAETVEQEARWSPNGKWVAFIGGKSYNTGDLELHLINSHGKEHKILTDFKEHNVKGPSWSPDSKNIMFDVRQTKNGISTLYTVDIESGLIKQLTTEEQGMYVQAEWSPDGKAILVAERNATNQGQSDLWVLAVGHTDHRRRVTDTPAGETMPVWGNDGKYVIFSRPSGTKGLHDLFAFHFDTKKEYRLTSTNSANEFFPIPSPDGKSVFFDSFKQIDGQWSSTIMQIPLPDFSK